jgi:hypothetical protein
MRELPPAAPELVQSVASRALAQLARIDAELPKWRERERQYGELTADRLAPRRCRAYVRSLMSRPSIQTNNREDTA